MKRMPRSSPTRNPVTNAPASHPRRSKWSAGGAAVSAPLERLPDHDPRQQRGEGHSRSYSKTSITASQANRMPLRILLAATGAPGQPVTAQAAPRRTPRPIGPHVESPESEPNASSQAAGHSAVTPCLLCSGRMPSASIVPPASRPCYPSTFRLSRSPQPASRRNSRGHPSPLPHRPAAFCGRTLRLSPPVTPAERRAISRQQTYLTINPSLPEDCLILRIHSRPSRKVCASRTFVLNSPFGPYDPPGG